MRISTTRWVWPLVSPFFHSAWRERLKYHASPVAMVFASASAFMCATISTSPHAASVATQVTSPSASNFGLSAAPSSSAALVPGGAKGDLSDNESPLPASAGGRSTAHQRDEPHLVFGAVAERAEKPRGHGRDTRLADAANRHAGVLGLDQHGDAVRLEDVLDGRRHLRGELLLGLQPARIDVDQAGEFRQADHALDRPVRHMGLAVKRHHVMLAMGGEADVADQHEIVIGLGLAEGADERLGRHFAVAAIKLVQGCDHTFGGGL